MRSRRCWPSFPRGSTGHGSSGCATSCRGARRGPRVRTSSTAALAASATEVAEALSSLSGQVLDDVALTVNGPGAFGLALTVGGREIAVRLDRQGVRLHSVGV